jgi:hypothetical protein
MWKKSKRSDKVNWTKRISERPWHGFLCVETVEGIAKAISNILTGKLFTVAVCHDYSTPIYLPNIEVRTGCKLRAAWCDKSNDPIKWEERPSTVQFAAGGYHMIFMSRYEGNPCEGLPLDFPAYPYFKIDRNEFAVYEKNYENRMHQWKFVVEGDEPLDPFDCRHLKPDQLQKMIREAEENLTEMRRVALLMKNEM